MAINYSPTAKNARMAAVVAALNGGVLKIGTSGMGTVLVSFPLSATSGTVSNGVITFSLTSSTATATGTGTAAAAVLYASDGSTAVVSGLTVGTTGTDVTINATAVSSGQSITATGNQTITHSA